MASVVRRAKHTGGGNGSGRKEYGEAVYGRYRRARAVKSA